MLQHAGHSGVREGEAWPLEGFLRLRAVASMRNRARELGVDAPEPKLGGGVKVRAIRSGPTGPQLELELDALLELDGTLRKDGRTGTMSSGNRFQGLATVDARTGVPVTFDVTHTSRMHVRSGGDDVVVGGTVTVRGTVTRSDAGK